MPSAQLKLNPLTQVTLQCPELMNGSRLHRYPSLYQLNTRENHDEPRAAATFALEKHQAAAVLTYLCPGLRIFREGQFEGRIKKVPYILTGNQPSRRNRSCATFTLGSWIVSIGRRPETGIGACWRPRWHGAATGRVTVLSVLLGIRRVSHHLLLLTALRTKVCYLRFPSDEIRGHTLRTLDLMSSVVFERDGEELVSAACSSICPRGVTAHSSWRRGGGSSVSAGQAVGRNGVFDRSAPLPTGGHLEQADGTAWMALFSQNMLELAFEITAHDPTYEPMIMKFAEHFCYIGSAMNRPGQDGMWDEEDGFYYDLLRSPDGSCQRLKVRSMVGLLPLCATTVTEKWMCERIPRTMANIQERLRRIPELKATIHPTGAGHFGVAGQIRWD